LLEPDIKLEAPEMIKEEIEATDENMEKETELDT
jgi:hypothetical protein